jgi:hypothetical protein
MQFGEQTIKNHSRLYKRCQRFEISEEEHNYKMPKAKGEAR